MFRFKLLLQYEAKKQRTKFHFVSLQTYFHFISFRFVLLPAFLFSVSPVWFKGTVERDILPLFYFHESTLYLLLIHMTLPYVLITPNIHTYVYNHPIYIYNSSRYIYFIALQYMYAYTTLPSKYTTCQYMYIYNS